MEPAWHAASEALQAVGSNVKLAKIDASDPTNQSVGSLYGVKGYPTMKTFINGFPLAHTRFSFLVFAYVLQECWRLHRPPTRKALFLGSTPK